MPGDVLLFLCFSEKSPHADSVPESGLAGEDFRNAEENSGSVGYACNYPPDPELTPPKVRTAKLEKKSGREKNTWHSNKYFGARGSTEKHAGYYSAIYFSYKH